MDGIKKIWKILLVMASIIVIFAVRAIRADTMSATLISIMIVFLVEFVGVILIKKTMADGIPDDKEKRILIIKRFCDKYGLNLSDRDIGIISDASYCSSIWAEEVMAMNKSYLDLGEWFCGNAKTIWLRVYLFVFPVKDITQDLDQLYSIAVERDFKNLANVINEKRYLSLDECIKSINNKYYLNFDKISFALFTYIMRQKGMKIVLADVGQVGFEDEMSALIRKYS